MIPPYISRKDIDAALKSLIQTTHAPDLRALHHLLLVELILNEPTMPDSDEALDFAAHELLVRTITDGLIEARTTFSLAEPNVHAAKTAALNEMRADQRAGSVELMAWSVLYHRFVRTDLDLSVAELAGILGPVERSISRYTRLGVRLLTRRLYWLEEQVRREQVQRRLYAALPLSVRVHLIGRAELLDTVEAQLQEQSPQHLLITGAPGIGKTLFAQELLRRFIDQERLDHLVWLDQPVSVQFAREQIAATLLREGSAFTLAEALQAYHTAVVLDGLEAVADDSAALNRLLRDLGAAVVVAIHPAYLQLETTAAHLPLPPIAPDAAELLVEESLRFHRSADAQYSREAAREITPELYTRVGGNPLALRLGANLWDELEWEPLQRVLQERLLHEAFARSGAEVQRLWCGLALMPRPVSGAELAALWDVDPQTAALLVHAGAAERQNDVYRLIGAARAYVQREYSQSPVVRDHVDRLIETMRADDPAFEVLEHVLVTDFPSLSAERRVEWIRALWREGIKRGHWAQWRVILEPYARQTDTADPQIRIAYGICLRRLADWDGARQVFFGVIADCGMRGQFHDQARAIVEWSILARYRGNYAEAKAWIEQAKRFALRAADHELTEALTLQEAQILIEQGKGGEAYGLLASLTESARVLLLRGEAQLMLKQPALGRTLAQRGLALSGDHATEASLHVLIGRAYEQESALEQAYQHLREAVNLLERLEDPFMLARAQTNLAAVQIQREQFLDARRLIDLAGAVQHRLGDQVGLMVTRHNRTRLDQHIAR